jgi:hypothetical protein
MKVKLRTFGKAWEAAPRSRTKLTGSLVLVALVVGGSLFISGGANAVSTKHKVVFRGNANEFSEASPAIEPKANVKITCDSSTNTFTATVKNVSVIDGYLNPFPKDNAGKFFVTLGGPGPGAFYYVELSQNPKTGLFDGSGSGSLDMGPPPYFPACYTGATWRVVIGNATYATEGTMS